MIRPYRGKVFIPSMMTTQSILAYVKWSEEYFKWCEDGGGRESLKVQLANKIQPYIQELEHRKTSLKGRWA